MCLILGPGKVSSQLRTATKDIKVYKILSKTNDRFYSFIQRFTYTKGYHYYQKPDSTTDENGFGIRKRKAPYKPTVHEGFHSYTKMPTLSVIANLPSWRVVVEMIIPKGAKYYRGRRKSPGEIVSNEIIFPSDAKVITPSKARRLIGKK